MRYEPSPAEVVSCFKLVCIFVATTFAPATTACERSCTTPRIDPVTSARNTAALASAIETIEIRKKRRKQPLLIRHPHLVRSLCRSAVEVKKAELNFTFFECGQLRPGDIGAASPELKSSQPP